MNKRFETYELVEIIADIIAGFVFGSALLVLSVIFLVVPPLVVFVQGCCGWWLWLMFTSLFTGYGVYLFCKDIYDGVARLIKRR